MKDVVTGKIKLLEYHIEATLMECIYNVFFRQPKRFRIGPRGPSILFEVEIRRSLIILMKPSSRGSLVFDETTKREIFISRFGGDMRVYNNGSSTNPRKYLQKFKRLIEMI